MGNILSKEKLLGLADGLYLLLFGIAYVMKRVHDICYTLMSHELHRVIPVKMFSQTCFPDFKCCGSPSNVIFSAM
jgi:hypothetical protein